MHLLLTDRLTCPRCGPTFGLILLADRMEDRSVVEGRLGCPNCRDSFPIRSGFGDLRAPPRGDPPPGWAGAPPDGGGTEEECERVVALLGITGGPGTVGLVGEPARCADAVAAVGDELHVVAIDPDLRAWPPRARVSRIMASPGLPFFSGTLRGVAVDGRMGDAWLREAARVVVPKGRVVVAHAPSDGGDTLRAEGLTVLAAEAETVVAARS